MPTIAPGDRVLVTGANGYLAAHLIDALLKKGYTVRGSVRSLGKGEHLKELFGESGDKFELVVVEDITVVRLDFSALASSTGHSTF
jgi:nucleoside-diphosphate-sugar epimerase